MGSISLETFTLTFFRELQADGQLCRLTRRQMRLHNRHLLFKLVLETTSSVKRYHPSRPPRRNENAETILMKFSPPRNEVGRGRDPTRNVAPQSQKLSGRLSYYFADVN